MSMDSFYKKYNREDKRPITKIVSKWKANAKADELLGSKIMTGVLLGDALLNGSSIDQIHPDVKDAFLKLMKGKVDSYSELRELVAAKYENSPKSVEGLISKIQGQYGENVFKEAIGNGAELATDGSQPGWDIKIPRDDGIEYVQVKVYNDSSKVIEHINNVNERIANGEIEDVTQINFAVNSDIFHDVKEKMDELGLTNKIYDIGANRDDIRETLESGLEAIQNTSLLDNLFSELFSLSASAAMIHAASNAFLVWKCNKEKSQALEDTFYSSAISTGGIAASVGTRAVIMEAAALTEIELLGTLLGPVGLVASIGVGYGTREFLKRIVIRKDIFSSLLSDIEYNEELILNFQNKTLIKKAA